MQFVQFDQEYQDSDSTRLLDERLMQGEHIAIKGGIRRGSLLDPILKTHG